MKVSDHVESTRVVQINRHHTLCALVEHFSSHLSPSFKLDNMELDLKENGQRLTEERLSFHRRLQPFGMIVRGRRDGGNRE